MSETISLRVLIVEDDAAFHAETTMKVTGLGHTVVGGAYNGSQALSLAEQLKPDVVFIDIAMPDPETGIEDRRAGIRATEAILNRCPAPIIWLTANETPQLLEEAGKLGVSAYLVKPPRPNEIARAISLAHSSFRDKQELRHLNTILQREIAKRREAERALRESEEKFRTSLDSSPIPIALSDQNGVPLFVNKQFVATYGYSTQDISSLADWLNLANANADHQGNALELWHQDINYAMAHKAITPPREYQILCKNGKVKIAEITVQFESDMLIGIFQDITERRQIEKLLKEANVALLAHLDEIEQLKDELHEQAMRDPLTGLYNRRYMEDAFAREFARATREHYPISIIMLDLDRLKMLNDDYGHITGDHALQTLATCLINHTRASDIVCRYGGDEFTIIMTNTDSENSLKRVNEWRRFLQANPLSLNAETKVPIKFTAGIACLPTDGDSLEEVAKCADIALYEAKEQGRNRTVLFAQLENT